MKGHATNLGNLTINVTINYDAKNATGGVIGSSSAAGLRPTSSFKRTNVDVSP